MKNFDLKKYLAEGKLLKENESSWVSNFEKLLADGLDIEIRDLRMKVIDPHLIKIGAGFSQQGLDVFPEIVNSILQTPEFKGKMVFVGDEDVAEEISEKHPELEDDVWNDEFFWIYVKSPLSEDKPLKEDLKPSKNSDDIFPEVPEELNDMLKDGNEFISNRIIVELEGPNAGWYDYNQNMYSTSEFEWWGPFVYSNDKAEQERIIFDQDAIPGSEKDKKSKVFKKWLLDNGVNVKEVYLGDT